MFIDEAPVSLKAGDGGAGCVSFRRLKFRPKGGPDGGNGGKGGDIVIACDGNVGDLKAYKFNPIARAKNGIAGKGNDCDGRNGAPSVLKVPAGTQVVDEGTEEIVADLVAQEQRVVALKGGVGGRCNLSYKSSINRAPQQSTPGIPGEEGRFRFVLKTIADVGLVGFPNAGKSSLTNLITRARPKMAPYPFTTLNPNIGIVDYRELFERISIADIPGLITGAHANRGLGHRFLRHIERCPLLLLILDMAGVDGRDPCRDYRDLIKELELYNHGLTAKPRLVAANKMDEPAAEENLAEFRRSFKVGVLPISCLSEEGIEELKTVLLKQVLELRSG